MTTNERIELILKNIEDIKDILIELDGLQHKRILNSFTDELETRIEQMEIEDEH